MEMTLNNVLSTVSQKDLIEISPELQRITGVATPFFNPINFRKTFDFNLDLLPARVEIEKNVLPDYELKFCLVLEYMDEENEEIYVTIVKDF